MWRHGEFNNKPSFCCPSPSSRVCCVRTQKHRNGPDVIRARNLIGCTAVVIAEFG